MSATRENAVKYDQLVSESMTDKVGTVHVSEFTFQLCDHVQKLEEEYYATAFYDGLKAEGRDINGIYYKMLGNTPIALIPLARLETAYPIYEDNGLTQDMLNRLIKTLSGLNGPVFSREIPAGSSKKAAA